VATRTETYTITELRELLLPFCENHPIAKLEVFGSIADGTARIGSDVDLMVTFKAGAKVGAEFLDMVLELEDLLGCRVDLVDRASVEIMENWILRRSILESVRTIYAA
jgi:predicted nucleotidyltransferase